METIEVKLKDADKNTWHVIATFRESDAVFSFFKNNHILRRLTQSYAKDSIGDIEWFTKHNGAIDMIKMHFGVDTLDPEIMDLLL